MLAFIMEIPLLLRLSPFYFIYLKILGRYKLKPFTLYLCISFASGKASRLLRKGLQNLRDSIKDRLVMKISYFKDGDFYIISCILFNLIILDNLASLVLLRNNLLNKNDIKYKKGMKVLMCKTPKPQNPIY